MALVILPVPSIAVLVVVVLVLVFFETLVGFPRLAPVVGSVLAAYGGARKWDGKQDGRKTWQRDEMNVV
jgi:hypothetical protein